MTTRNVELVPSEYRLITDEETFLTHNVDDNPIYVVFADSAPSVGSIKPHPLKPGEGLRRDGLTGDLYGFSQSPVVSIPVTE